MKKAIRSGSRANAVTASLRGDILGGRLEPGRRLTFPELCATYSVSVGVLREALVRLADHGIVRTESNLGFSVMSLSDTDLLDLFRTRALTEPGFVREAVLRGSLEWEGQLMAAHHMLEKTPMEENARLSDAWTGAHAHFHQVLISGAGNRRMLEITSRLREEADLYRRWYLDLRHIGQYSKQVADEHRQLMDAALARDSVGAESLMRQQLEQATAAWLKGRPVERSA
jgi:DNA-binding GntR family transcriptional regulator